MKNKSLYIYGGLIVVIVLSILLFNYSNEKSPDDIAIAPNTSMPDDDVHKGLGQDMPSSGNVRGEFMDKFNNLKNKFAENPQDTAVAKEFAIILSQAHRKPQAMEIYNDIIKQDPTRADIYLLLGFEYYGMQDYNNAEIMTKKVVELQKDNAQAQYNLGAINLAKGNKDEAKRIWMEVIDKYPGTEAAEFAKSSLDGLSGNSQIES
jgi:tetratricopeptide (TPR) repeat protein